MTTSEKVAYLKGLAEGMGLENAGQGKLLNVVIDILEDLALDLADTRNAVEELNDGMEEMGDDLAALEDEFYDTVYGEFDPAEIDGEKDEDDEDEEEEEDDDVFYTVTCPGCGAQLTVDEELVEDGDFECPECGEVIDFATAKLEPVEFEDEDKDERPL
jgi:predicted RNA-binding Zn-ribbon protein involved in translation (DUF1610 family)